MLYSKKLEDLQNIFHFIKNFSIEWPKIKDNFISTDYSEFPVFRYECSICHEKGQTINSIFHKKDCFIGKLEESFKLIEENSN